MNPREYVDDLSNDPYADAGTDLGCPKCHGSMTLRQGSYGAFFGCDNYPTCKGIRSYNSAVIKYVGAEDWDGAYQGDYGEEQF